MPIDLACTGCRRRLSVRDEFSGRQVRCPACGAMVLATPPAPAPAPLQGFAGPFFAPSPEPPPEPKGRPWIAVLHSPSAFFASRGARSGIAQAAATGLPFLLLGATGTAVQFHLIGLWLQPVIARSLKSAGLGEGLLDRAASLPIALRDQFVFEAVGLVLYPLALHLGVVALGGSGLRKTCSIYLYSLTARVLDLLPFGFVVSFVYVLVLNYLGIRHTHGLSGGRSMGALLLGIVVSAIGLLILLSCFALLRVIPSHGGR